MTHARPADGLVPSPERLADIAAIEGLAVAYAYALDDRDWTRWEDLFDPNGLVDYRSAGGIAGSPAEVARWLADALSVFSFCLHSVSTHEICFVDDHRASGRVHVANRNGVEWEGTAELVDVDAVYHDRYVRRGERWTIERRVEETLHVSGGRFAEIVRSTVRPADLSPTDDG